MDAELITNLEALDGIEAEWRPLAELRGNAFITPEWFRAWWGAYGEGHRPAVVVARDRGGAIAGVLPLVRSQGRPRLLRFAGANLGDLFHPAAREADEEAVAVAARTALDAAGESTIVLDYAPASGTWPQALASGGRCRFSEIEQRRADLPFVATEGTWEDYLGTRSKKFRKRLRYLERSLSREHRVGVREVRESGELEAAFARFFELHDKRFGERGGSSLASPAARAMHKEFMAAVLEQGWLRLRFLEVDGRAVASLYGWRLGPRYAFYQGGFDPDWSRHSVGTLLVAATLRSAIEEGAEEFDMLLGREAYKARFTDRSRPVRSVALVRPGHPLRVVLAAEARLRRAGSGLAAKGGPPARLARAIAARLPTGRRA